MNVRIEIDTRTFVRFWLVVIGFVLVAFAIYSARVALILIGAALFLAIILGPSVNRLAKLFPSKSRTLGTVLAYVAVVLVLGCIIFLAVPPIVDQTVKFAQNIPSLIDSATKQYSGINDVVNHYQLQAEFAKVVTSIKDGASQFAAGLGSMLITGIGSVLYTITSVMLVLVMAFLMLIEGPLWLRRLWSIYKDKDRMENHRNLVERMYNVVTSYATGQLSVSAIAGLVSGVLAFVLCIIFGIPVNLAIPAAVIIFVLSLIPLFGETIGVLLVSLILALNSLTAAIIFIIFFIVYGQIEGNFISPKIQSKRIDLPALAILASVTIGVFTFGIIGGIISIPIAGCLRVLIENYYTYSKKKHTETEKIAD
jgi:predicted PurR-regulated permease PerM